MCGIGFYIDPVNNSFSQNLSSKESIFESDLDSSTPTSCSFPALEEILFARGPDSIKFYTEEINLHKPLEGPDQICFYKKAEKNIDEEDGTSKNVIQKYKAVDNFQCESSASIVSTRNENINEIAGYTLRLNFIGSVLHMRGQEVCVQPVKDKYGNILLWNGEIYQYSGEDIENLKEKEESSEEETDTLFSSCPDRTSTISDTLFLSKKFSEIGEEEETAKISSSIRNILSKVQGPYAFIFYHAKTKEIYFGRDPFGRRSLLFHSFDGLFEGGVNLSRLSAHLTSKCTETNRNTNREDLAEDEEQFTENTKDKSEESYEDQDTKFDEEDGSRLSSSTKFPLSFPFLLCSTSPYSRHDL